MSQKLERFQKYLKQYENLVWRHVNNHVYQCWVDDVMQETFIKLYDHLDYLPDAKVKPWLLITAGNIAKDYGRKGGKFENISIDDEESLEYLEENFEALSSNVEDVLNQKAVHELLRTALELLYEKNPVWYYVLIDFYMLEMSTKEIAEVLNLTVSNIDVIKIRARKFLRKELGKQYRDIF